MHRLFVGLRPPAPVRAVLRDAMGGIHNARWQSDEQVHCTLRFIGEVERPLAEDIAAVLDTLYFPAFEVALSGVGCFGPRARPNAVWAGLRPHAQLAALHHKIDQALIRTGLAPEGRAYLPHITLARLNRSAGPLDRYLRDHAGLASEPFRADHFLLFESILGRDGARYQAIARYPLRAAPASGSNAASS